MVAPATVQLRVVDWPAARLDGNATKLEMVGKGNTTTVAVADCDPALLEAVSV